MTVTVPIIAADGAQSTVTLPAPVVSSPASGPLAGALIDNAGNMCWMTGQTAGVTPKATWDYLHAQGVRIVRQVLYWEPLQPPLTPVLDSSGQPITATGKGPLSSYHMNRIATEIQNAYASGIVSVPVFLNYARYRPSAATNSASTAAPQYVFGVQGANYLPPGDFVDLWTKASVYWKGLPGIHAYDIMNEPHDMPNSDRAAAIVWESYSQQVVTALRAAGDTTTIWVEGMDFSGPWNWATLHPAPWINDPLNKVVYSAHEYTNWTTISGSGTSNNELRYNQVAALQNMTPVQMASFATSGATSFANWVKAHPGTRCSLGEIGTPSYEALINFQKLDPATATANATLWNNLMSQMLAIYAGTGTLDAVTMWSAQNTFWANGVAFYSNLGGTYTVVGGKNVPVVTDVTNSNWSTVKAIGV